MRAGFCDARTLSKPPWGGRGAAYAAFMVLLCAAGAVSGGSGGSPGGVVVTDGATIVGPATSPFHMPTDVCVGVGGDVYVLDGTAHRVVVYDYQGAFKFEFGGQGSESGQLLRPLGITAGRDGKIYVADSGNGRFQVFDARGRSLAVVPLPEEGASEEPDPTDVVVDPNRSRIFVADNDNHRICLFNLKDYSFEEVWGEGGLGRRQFRYPFLMDMTSQGYLLVVESINTRVQALNPDGKFVSFIGGWGVREGQLFRPKGVAALGALVFVTDSYLGRVQIFDMRGRFLGVVLDANGAAVKFVTPTGITADARRRCLYVVELKANRVRRMDLEPVK